MLFTEVCGRALPRSPSRLSRRRIKTVFRNQRHMELLLFIRLRAIRLHSQRYYSGRLPICAPACASAISARKPVSCARRPFARACGDPGCLLCPRGGAARRRWPIRRPTYAVLQRRREFGIRIDSTARVRSESARRESISHSSPFRSQADDRRSISKRLIMIGFMRRSQDCSREMRFGPSERAERHTPSNRVLHTYMSRTGEIPQPSTYLAVLTMSNTSRVVSLLRIEQVLFLIPQYANWVIIDPDDSIRCGSFVACLRTPPGTSFGPVSARNRALATPDHSIAETLGDCSG